MLKKITNKIEKIRLEPEQVRLRWVWTCVLLCMCLITTAWLFSINLMFQKNKPANNQSSLATPAITEQLNDLKQQTPSLEQFTTESLNIDNEGIGNTGSTNKTGSYVPQTSVTEIPQTDAYSQLQNNKENQ